MIQKKVTAIQVFKSRNKNTLSITVMESNLNRNQCYINTGNKINIKKNIKNI